MATWRYHQAAEELPGLPGAKRYAVSRGLGHGADQEGQAPLSPDALASEGHHPSETRQAWLVDERAHADRVGTKPSGLLGQVRKQGNGTRAGDTAEGESLWNGWTYQIVTGSDGVVEIAVLRSEAVQARARLQASKGGWVSLTVRAARDQQSLAVLLSVCDDHMHYQGHIRCKAP